jgi:hypothetical protein
LIQGNDKNCGLAAKEVKGRLHYAEVGVARELNTAIQNPKYYLTTKS